MGDYFKYFKVSDGTEVEYVDMGGTGKTFFYVPGTARCGFSRYVVFCIEG